MVDSRARQRLECPLGNQLVLDVKPLAVQVDQPIGSKQEPTPAPDRAGSANERNGIDSNPVSRTKFHHGRASTFALIAAVVVSNVLGILNSKRRHSALK